jgi:hyperosmotically inducible periplasmic protein
MRKNAFVILGALVFAAFTVACGESDLGITTKVKSLLETDRNLNSAQIQVKTQNKVVTLSGSVPTPAEKEHAIAVARSVENVADVVDDLSVSTGATASAQAPQGSPPDDTSITEAVKQKLQAQPETANESIAVDTRQGVVTLSGTVKTAQAKDEVLQIARNTQGVQGVEDRLTVATVGG